MRAESARLLLERGVKFRLPAPLLLKWLLPRHLVIRGLKLGTLLEVARLTEEYQLEEHLLDPPLNRLSEVLAVAVLNDRLLIRYLRKPLARWLLWGVTSEGLLELWSVVRAMCDPAPFMTITTWVVTETRSLLAPRAQVGQVETEGS